MTGIDAKREAARIASEASAAVGETPLVAPAAGSARGSARSVVAKLEYLNPGGSVKDRIGVAMIDAAERDGALEPGGTIVEPTSGNTGIALAMVCAARGYELVLTLPEGMSRERTKLLRAYGAEVHETPSMGGMGEAIELANRIVAERGAFMPQQFSNPANPEIHRRTTAEEIWRDLDGEVDVLVTGVGTGGTITGVGQVLKERRPGVRVVAVEPASSAGALGRAPGTAQDPGDRRRLRARGARSRGDRRGDHGRRRVRARRGARRGPSRGPAGRDLGRGGDSAALEVAARPEMTGKRIVTIACDGGERYMSLPFFAPNERSARDPSPRRSARSAATSPPRATAIPRRAGSGRSEILSSWAGVQALLAHRVAHALYEAGVPLAPRTIAFASRAVTGVEIHPAARIGADFFIDHGSGVVIGETAEIGDRVTLYQGVTLGGTGFARGKRHPTLEDDVTVGSGAKLLGPVNVGRGAKVGANTVVIEDVPANSTVVGNPGHPVRVEGRRPEGPDADWIHLPDPIADAIKALSERLG